MDAVSGLTSNDTKRAPHIPPSILPIARSRLLRLRFVRTTPQDPRINPDFAHFNRVVLWYCDGASFSGNAENPVPSPKTIHGGQMFFRGRRVLDALLQV